ncbi:MAG: DUF2007 domain-containing protein [Gemmatimonadota bacterium]
MTDLVTIARYGYRHEAELAKGFLDNAGIPSQLSIDDVGGMEVGLAFANPARLLVSATEAERAVAVLKDVFPDFEPAN